MLRFFPGELGNLYRRDIVSLNLAKLRAERLQYTYDGDNHILTLQADEPAGAHEKTQYFYAVTTGSGSNVNSNDILSATQYPDPTTGNPSPSQQRPTRSMRSARS